VYACIFYNELPGSPSLVLSVIISLHTKGFVTKQVLVSQHGKALCMQDTIDTKLLNYNYCFKNYWFIPLGV